MNAALAESNKRAAGYAAPSRRTPTGAAIRVLVLTDTNGGGRAGAEQHLKTLAERLDPDRFVLHIVQLARSVPQAEGRIGCASFSHLPTGRLLSAHGLRRMVELYRLMRDGRYDCLLSYFESSDLIAALVGPLAGIRRRISSRRDTGFRHSAWIRLAYRLINGRFQAIIAASEAIRQALLAEGADDRRVHLVHNGIDPDRFEGADGAVLRTNLGIPRDATVLGMVANLFPVKNHALVIRALAGLERRYGSLHLVLAGDGPLRGELRELAAREGLAERVHFLGRRTDIEAVYAAMDVFVLASQTEGLSNALLEAMAAGRPAVATAVGGNPEVLRDGVTGLLVPPDDPRALEQALGRLIESEALRRSTGAAARERAATEFSVAAMVDAYAALIERTARSGRVAA